MLIMEIKILHHATIKIVVNKTIYFDPYDISEELHDADYIFITHDHYDHYDKEAISKIKKATTKIIVPKVLSNEENNLVVEPNKKYTIDDLSFETLPSYNLDKPFHPREKDYVGYNILLQDEYFYIMGDTDQTKEAEKVLTDVCFIPIGGIYTMDVNEAAAYINRIKPKIAIPIHYGKIVGEKELGEEFKNKVNKNIEVKLLMEEN